MSEGGSGTYSYPQIKNRVMTFRYFSTVLIAIFLLASDLSTAAAADSAIARPSFRSDTPSGFPVPRFLSLKFDKTNCRMGPSLKHDVRYTYMREGLPVLVIAETVDHWRKVRDQNGDECWMHKTTLQARTHVLLTNDANLFASPKIGARPRGLLGRGVLARIEKQKHGWVRLSVGDVRGWAVLENAWGDDALSALKD